MVIELGIWFLTFQDGANYIVGSCILVIDFTMVINGREYSRLRTCQLPGFSGNRMYDSLNCGS